MKKFAIIAGAMAMAGALFLASPVSAQPSEKLTATLNDDGSATITGTGFQTAIAEGLYTTVCTGADVTSNTPVTPGNFSTACPSLTTDALNPALKITPNEDGTFSADISADRVGTVPEEGVVVLVGCLPFGCQDTERSGFVILKAAAEEPAAEEPAEEEADEEPAAEEADEEPAAEEAAEEPAEEAAEEPAEEAAEGAGGEEDPMTEEGPMEEEGTMAEGADTMADTGAESGLLAVIGVSVLLAGLFAVGIGRRFTKRS